jgi:hypothetical protein
LGKSSRFTDAFLAVQRTYFLAIRSKQVTISEEMWIAAAVMLIIIELLVDIDNQMSNDDDNKKIKEEVSCPYCQSKFKYNAELSKHIDRLHTGMGLLEGDKRQW